MTETLWHIVLIDSLPEGGVRHTPFYEFFKNQADVDQFIKARKTTKTVAQFSGPLEHREVKPRTKPRNTRYWL